MESNIIKRQLKREKRVLRVRKHVRGTSLKPRLTVSKTNKHINAQLIDDEKGLTLVSAGTVHAETQGGSSAERKKTKGTKAAGSKKVTARSKEAAKQIGLKIAELAIKKDIKTIVFDRGRFKYHGVIAELANAAREGGLQF